MAMLSGLAVGTIVRDCITQFSIHQMSHVTLTKWTIINHFSVKVMLKLSNVAEA